MGEGGEGEMREREVGERIKGRERVSEEAKRKEEEARETKGIGNGNKIERRYESGRERKEEGEKRRK